MRRYVSFNISQVAAKEVVRLGQELADALGVVSIPRVRVLLACVRVAARHTQDLVAEFADPKDTSFEKARKFLIFLEQQKKVAKEKETDGK